MGLEFSKVRWVLLSTVVGDSGLVFQHLSLQEDSIIFSKGGKSRREESRLTRLREKLMVAKVEEGRGSSNLNSSLKNCIFLNHSLNSCEYSTFLDRVTSWI